MRPRYTPKELVLKYQRAPLGARELIVEGRRDQSLWRWFFQSTSTAAAQLSIVTVDSIVEVGSELVLARGLSVGARGRLSTISQILVESLVESAPERVRSVIDANGDYAGGHDSTVPPILCRTDGATLLGSLINEAWVADFLQIGLQLPHERERCLRVSRTVLEACRALFVTRVVSAVGQYNLRLQSCAKHAVCDHDGLRMEAGAYQEACFRASPCGRKYEEFSRDVGRANARLAEEPTASSLNDHDLFDVLRLYAHEVSGGSPFGGPEGARRVEDWFRAKVRIEDLQRTKIGGVLMGWVGP